MDILHTATLAALVHQVNMDLFYQNGFECTLDCLSDLTEMFVLPDNLIEMVDAAITDLKYYPHEKYEEYATYKWLEGY